MKLYWKTERTSSLTATRVRSRLKIVAAIALAVIVLPVVWLGSRLLNRDREIWEPDVISSPALIARGEYLTRAADCAACHTVRGEKPFAGGVAFKLPFGTIYSNNITPDKETGIGTWSDDDFVRALHSGVSRNGANLYPAFPYTSYTGMSRADAVAIKAYLFSLAPVRAPAAPNGLSFPFNHRWLMALWNLVFLDEHRFRNDPDLTEAGNRGAYLANVLGHCGECHTPRNFAYALDGSRQFAGAVLQGWRAYNISSDHKSGVGAWSDRQLADYLQTGHAEGRGSASGPMAEAITESLQHLTVEDVSSLVGYLRKVPPQGPDADGWTGRTESPANSKSVAAFLQLGKRVFDGNCSGCHMPDGRGRQTPYADLSGTRSLNDPSGNNMIRVLLTGTDLRGVHPVVTMPGFAGGLSDLELASVANYLIERLGGAVGRVSTEDVRRARTDGS